MSFSKTVSVVAALTTIFVAAGTGYKLAKENQPEETQKLDARIEQLEQELKDKTAQIQVPQVAPAPTQLPPTQPQTTPPPVTLPSPPVNLMPAPPPPPTTK